MPVVTGRVLMWRIVPTSLICRELIWRIIPEKYKYDEYVVHTWKSINVMKSTYHKEY
jgi:hypothetical protein